MSSSTSEEVPRRHVFIIPNDTSETSSTWGDIVSLPHPHTGLENRFLVKAQHIYEIQCVEEPHRTWFVDNNVVKDGKLYLATPIDPLFLILPSLDSARQGSKAGSAGLFKPWDELVPATFLGLTELKETIKTICEFKKIELEPEEETSYYRLSDTKVYTWLSKKFELLCTHFQASSGDARIISFQIISEYLTPQWAQGFQNQLGIAETDLSAKDTNKVNTFSHIINPNVYNQPDFPEAKKEKSIVNSPPPKLPRGMQSIASFLTIKKKNQS